MTLTDVQPDTGTTRAVPAALVTAGIALALYPIIRPASDERTLDGAAAIGATAGTGTGAVSRTVWSC